MDRVAPRHDLLKEGLDGEKVCSYRMLGSRHDKYGQGVEDTAWPLDETRSWCRSLVKHSQTPCEEKGGGEGVALSRQKEE